MMDNIKKKINLLKEEIKILQSKDFIELYELAEEFCAAMISTSWGTIDIWCDSMPTKELLVIALRNFAQLGFLNRDRDFKVNLNEIATGNFAWYLVNKDKPNIHINLLLPSKNTSCRRVQVGEETTKQPIYKVVCD